jgi:endonuclease-3 related protein
MLNHRLLKVYQQLHDHFGPRHWWPAESPFEVAVGAILTQNTAWANVEQAIANLKTHNVLSPGGIQRLPRTELEALIRPAGFFRQKAGYLQLLTSHLLEQADGDLATLCQGPLNDARNRLLTLRGVGPETADSILLYAAAKPSFVVDAYTRRILTRLGIIHGKESYDAIRQMFMENLPQETELFNEYHALIVELAKTICRKNNPACERCPLLTSCSHGQEKGPVLGI